MIQPWIVQPVDAYTPEHTKTALFVNLYYEEKLDRCFSYLERLPESVDLYLSTSNPDVEEKLRDYQKEHPSHRIFVVRGVNRGRDVAAFLVTMKAYLLDYDVIGIVHDKKAKLGEKFTFIDTFAECLWDNLLGGRGHVNAVLKRFESEPELGGLFVPILMGDYTHVWHDPWRNNIDNTVALAETLGVGDLAEQIANGYLPSTYGTVFWARTDALRMLLEKDWKYEDFPEEPAPIDGGITHAIERVIEVVVRKAGYETYNILSPAYAEKYLYFLETKLQSSAMRIHRSDGDLSFADNVLLEKMAKLLGRCPEDQKIYIYGAGKYGEICYRQMGLCGRIPDAFVQSVPEQSEKCGIPVIGPDGITDGSLVIIAVARDALIEEIRKTLAGRNVTQAIYKELLLEAQKEIDEG